MKTTLLRASCLAVATAVALLACGGDDSSGAGSSGSTTGTTGGTGSTGSTGGTGSTGSAGSMSVTGVTGAGTGSTGHSGSSGSTGSTGTTGTTGTTGGTGSSGSGVDAGHGDAGHGAGIDAGHGDAGHDAGIDASADASVDASHVDAAQGEAGADATLPDVDAGDDASVLDAGHDSGTATTDAGPPTFTEVYAIISANCVVCHKPGSSGVTGGQLDMSTMTLAYDNLVGVLAAGAACGTDGTNNGLERVVAGSSATSLLWNKVASAETGGPAVTCGASMPRGGPALPAQDVTLVAAWINAGALDN